MTKYIRIQNSSIKKEYIDSFEKILNNVILNNNKGNNNYILSECNTIDYIYILGLIVDERNKNDKDKFYSILDETDVILDGFDLESFFKKTHREKKYFINPNEPGPIDPLRADFDEI